MIKLQGPRYCPNCKADFTGEPIPEEQKQYSDSTHYSRIIGIEDPMIYDGTIMWYCPDCEHKWDAWNWREKCT